MVGFIAFWVICLAISFVLADKYRRSDWWIFFTALFPITLLLLIASGRKEGKGGFKKCVSCKELMFWEAKKCPKCQEEQPSESKPKQKQDVKQDVHIIAVPLDKTCEHCGCVNAYDSVHCFQCGKELT